jgi:preprotein translocase subunit SecG
MPTEVKWTLAIAVGCGLVWAGWEISWILLTLHILVCLLLIVVIMLQSGNAADLAGAFGGAGSQTAFGPRGPASFLSQATTWCAIVFMLSSLALSLKRSPGQTAGSAISSILEQTQKTTPAAAKPPVKPVTPPPASPRQAPVMPAPQSSSPAMPPPAAPKP